MNFHQTRTVRIQLLMLAVWLTVTMAGCVGPQGLSKTRLRYNQAISRTDEQETLLTLVRARYLDSNVLLRVSNVTTQYESSAGADFTGGLDGGDNTRLGGVAIGIADRPTIVLNPATVDFYKQLADPLSIEQIATLSSTFDFGKVIRLFVNNWNGLDNASTADGPTPPNPPTYEEFDYLADLLTQLQLAKAVAGNREQRRKDVDFVFPLKSVTDIIALKKEGFVVSKAESGDQYIVNDVEIANVLQLRVAPDTFNLVSQLQEVSGLDPGLDKYDMATVPEQITSYSLPTPRRTIEITPRSLQQSVYFMSQGVVVPQEHIESGQVRTTFNPDGSLFDWQQVVGGLIQIHCCKRKPRDARVAVKYRDYWFYIADGDVDSVESLRILDAAFGLQVIRKGGDDITTPVLTISAGR